MALISTSSMMIGISIKRVPLPWDRLRRDKTDAPPSTPRDDPASTELMAGEMSPASIYPSQYGPRSNSELSPAAEHELLHDVIFALRDRDRVVEAQRSKRGRPDYTYAGRGADDIGIIVDHSAVTEVSVDHTVDFAGGGPLRWSLIVPQRTSIGVNSPLQTDLLREEPERNLQFG